jgi:hypothetical protein
VAHRDDASEHSAVIEKPHIESLAQNACLHPLIPPAESHDDGLYIGGCKLWQKFRKNCARLLRLLNYR